MSLRVPLLGRWGGRIPGGGSVEQQASVCGCGAWRWGVCGVSGCGANCFSIAHAGVSHLSAAQQPTCIEEHRFDIEHAKRRRDFLATPTTVSQSISEAKLKLHFDLSSIFYTTSRTTSFTSWRVGMLWICWRRFPIDSTRTSCCGFTAQLVVRRFVQQIDDRSK